MNKTLRFNTLLRLDNKAGRHITAVFRAVEILVFLAVISRCSLMVPLALQISGDYFRNLSVTAVSPRFVFVIGNAIVIILFIKSGGRLPQPTHSPPPETTKYIVTVYPAGKKLPPAAEVKINCYRRSKSERICVKRSEKTAPVLRRMKTEKVERRVGCSYPEDGMSSEDFRRTIEDFIARQQRFLREEEEDDHTATAGTLAVTR